MAIKTHKKSDNTKLSENFHVSEFLCHGKGCCSTGKVDEKLVEILQKIRDHFGKPVHISSAYRCPKWNKAVGGVSGSYHLRGQAADIKVKDIAPAEVAKYAESIGVLGIGLYETNADGHFVHVDTRTKKSFWYGQKQAKRTTFGGKKELTVDGEWGKDTTKLSQKVLDTTEDGIISNQVENCKKYLPAASESSWEFKTSNYADGSALIKAVQKLVGAVQDGICGGKTVEAMQKFLKNKGFYKGTVDGVMGAKTVKAWQQYINSRI